MGDKSRVRKALQLYDYDGDGEISAAEIAFVRRKMPVVRIFRQFDASGKGVVAYETMLGAMKLICPSIPEPQLAGWLKTAGSTDDGSIDYDKFISWLMWGTSPRLEERPPRGSMLAANSKIFDFQCADASSLKEAYGKNSSTSYNDEGTERLIFHLFDDLFPSGAYDHEKFMAEFANVNWSDVTAAKWKPEASHFDFDLALSSKKAAWFDMFQKETLEKVISACKKVNRWNFMKAVYASGEDWMTSSLVWTLFTLAMMYEHVDFSNPELRVLDAGCGTGYMLAAWAVLTPPSAEVWGIEIDDEMVILARQEIFQSTDSFAFPEESRERKELLSQIEVVKGDVVRMIAGGIGSSGLSDMKPFPEDYFDLITCGVALPVPERTIQCLREGGILIIPEEVDPDAAVKGIRVSSKFKIYKKEGGKKVPFKDIEVPDDGKVNFVRAKDLGDKAGYDQ